MSDFGEIFEFLSNVVTTIVDFTVNVAFGALLVASLAAPWRWMEIFQNISFEEWKWDCFCSFVLTILDLITIPLLLFGFLSPLRWKVSFVLLVKKAIPKRHDRFDQRIQALIVPFVVIADLLSSVVGVFTLFDPFGRQLILGKVFFANVEGRAMTFDDDDYADELLGLGLTKAFFFYGLQAVLDILSVLFSMVCLLVPTTWSCFARGIRFQLNAFPTNLPEINSRYNRKRYYKAWDGWFTTVRDHVSVQILHAVVDFVVAPFLLVAAIAPYRNRQLMHLFAETRAARAHANDASAPTGEVEGETQPVRVYAPTYAPGDFHFEYDFELRKKIMYIGFLALGDFFLLPMLVPLYLTRYRYKATEKELFTEDSTWGHRQLFLVVSQFFLLIFDAFYLLLSLPLLRLTVIRWEPVRELLAEEDVFLRHNTKLYKRVLEQLLFLVIDILFLPFLLVVVLSIYRRPEIARVLNHPETLRDGLRPHYFVFVNFLTVVHDIALFLPFMLVLCVVGIHRIPSVVDALWLRPFKPYALPPGNTPQSLNDAKREQNHRMSHDWDNRFYCWGQFFAGLFDIPFFLMGICTMCTVWRASELLSRLRNWRTGIASNVTSLGTPDLTRLSESAASLKRTLFNYVKMMELYPSEVREILWEEFACLLRDILCLVPFAVVVGTVFRLYELINYFKAALRGEALKAEPLFEVVNVKIHYSTASAEPRVEVLLRPKNSEFSLRDPSQDWKNFNLRVLGSSFWTRTTELFGGMIAGLAKTYLPLLLKANESIGWSELSGTPNQILEVVVEDPSDEKEKEKDAPLPSAPPLALTRLWMNIPLKGVKKSTVIKKLRKYNSDTPMVWQMECASGSTSRLVLFRHAFSVGEIVEGLEKEGEERAVVEHSFSNGSVDLIGEKVPFVDEFHMLVLKVFVEVVLDIAHLILFILTMRSPRSFYKLMCCMLEAKGKTDLRLMEKTLYSLDQAEIHLRNFRSSLVPALNAVCKREFYRGITYRSTAEFRGYGFESADALDNALRKVQSEYDLGRYKSLIKAAKRDLALIELPNDSFAATMQSIWERHNDLLQHWFLKYFVWCFASKDLMDRKHIDLSSLIFSDEHDRHARKLASAKIQLLNLYAEEKHRVQDKKSKMPGFLKRSTEQNRSLIRAHFRSSIVELVGLLMLLLLTVTMVRFVPTVREIITNSYSSTPLNMRSLLTKQVRLLRNDLYYLGLSVVYISLLCMTVACLPAFLADLPLHIHSFRAVAECAEKHLKKFFDKLCELLSLLTVYRTYRLVLKSALYCALLPGAFIGDCIKGFADFNEVFRFFAGSFIFFGVLIACIVESAQLSESAREDDSADVSNSAILAITATGCALLILLAVMKLRSMRRQAARPALARAPRGDAKRLDFSWSHLVALALGPLDCLQLSAVIMYFFWQPVTVKGGSSVTMHLTDNHTFSQHLGEDGLSQIMFWGSEDAVHSSSYRTAMTIAVLIVIVWAMLIALPLAQGGKETSFQKQMKMLRIRNAPVFDALYVLLAQVLSVWIIATLMRSWSCFYDAQNESVLSTMPNITCGGGENVWAGTVSFPFLAYYMITSALVYSDSGTAMISENLNFPVNPLDQIGFVRFGATYTTMIKVVQCFICAACFGAFSTAPAIAVLLPIIVVCVFAALLPRVLRQFTSERVCNVANVLPSRSAGYLSVAWTATICLIRSFASSPKSMQNTEIFAAPGVIYVGWSVLFLLAALYIWWSERQLASQWERTMMEEGLQDAIGALTETFDLALVEAEQSQNFLTKSDLAMSQFKEKVRNARSVQDLAMLVLHLEDQIMIGKLSDDFLRQRNDWITNLEKVHEIFPPDRDVENNDNDADNTVSDMSLARYRFHSFMNLTAMLRIGFREEQVVSSLSRDVLSILLSNKLPRDVCWVIFEYLTHSKDLRTKLIDEERDSRQPQLLKTKADQYCIEMIYFLGNALHYKLKTSL